MDFDGSNDYASTTSSFNNPRTYTISAWMKTTLASGTKIVGFENRNVSLIKGYASAFAQNIDKGNRTVFFWVDVPSGWLSSQLFNATWNVTVVGNP
ncbi:hypothetical protein HYW20_07810 [Candidatus Woesearchaeota archaeon]|nr:hypothetical protein [Candidatus Woesearchaeota archaeon]